MQSQRKGDPHKQKERKKENKKLNSAVFGKKTFEGVSGNKLTSQHNVYTLEFSLK